MIKLSEPYRGAVKNLLHDFTIYELTYSQPGTRRAAISGVIAVCLRTGLYQDYKILDRIRSTFDK